jgi:RNA polymerase sporulation-specific sigma factor
MIDEQIRKHIGLVYLVVSRFESKYALPPGTDRDDLIQEGLLGLWEALEKYNPARSKFSTYAAFCIGAKLHRFFRWSRAQKRTGWRMVSLQMTTVDNEILEGIIPSEVRTDHTVERKLMLESLPERDRQIFLMYLEGFSQPELSRRFGLTQSYVSKLIRRTMKTVVNG